MTRALARIRRGIGTQATLWMLTFLVMGYLAGGWSGVGIMAALFGPFYLIGAWEVGGLDQ